MSPFKHKCVMSGNKEYWRKARVYLSVGLMFGYFEKLVEFGHVECVRNDGCHPSVGQRWVLISQYRIIVRISCSKIQSSQILCI